MKMNRCLVFLLGMFCFIALAAEEQSLDIWPHDKESAAKWNLRENSKWEVGQDGSYTLVVSNPTAECDVLNIYPLDPQKYAGYMLSASIEIKGDNITPPVPDYLGSKFMMPYRINGILTWLSGTDGLHGTYDWQKFSLNVMVLPDMDQLSIQLGLQKSSGTILFRNLQVKLVPAGQAAEVPFALPDNFRCEYSSAIQNRPPMRGVMGADPKLITLKDLQDLAKLGANLLRWQFINYRSTDLEFYRKELDESIDKLLAFAPELQKLGIMVVFDMHIPPGNRYLEPSVMGTAGSLAKLDGSVCLRLYLEDVYQEAYVETWKHIATRLKDCPVIWGYDLLNEPSAGGQKGKYNYLSSQYAAAKAIREIDPETPIVVEADEFASPGSFGYLLPIPVKNVYYQVHFYQPGEYTHQGVTKATLDLVRAGKGLKYPGIVNDVMIDKERLRGALKPVVAFQKKYGAKIFCGEFSAIRWAPGADQWLEDVLAIFAEHDWSWTYHAFREWHGWSVEHDSNCDNEQPVDYVTKRKQLLLNEFKKNQPISLGKIN